jgi:hypothetical protein
MGRILMAFLLGFVACKNQDTLKEYGKDYGGKLYKKFEDYGNS